MPVHRPLAPITRQGIICCITARTARRHTRPDGAAPLRAEVCRRFTGEIALRRFSRSGLWRSGQLRIRGWPQLHTRNADAASRESERRRRDRSRRSRRISMSPPVGRRSMKSVTPDHFAGATRFAVDCDGAERLHPSPCPIPTEFVVDDNHRRQPGLTEDSGESAVTDVRCSPSGSTLVLLLVAFFRKRRFQCAPSWINRFVPANGIDAHTEGQRPGNGWHHPGGLCALSSGVP